MRVERSPRDTALQTARIQFSILRKIGAAARAQMAIELSDSLRAIIESGVRQRHPEYDENMVRLASIRLSLGKRLFRQFYPEARVKI